MTSYLYKSGCPTLSRGPCSGNHKNERSLHSSDHSSANGRTMCVSLVYLSGVVHLDLGDVPVAGLLVVLQPRLSSEQTTQSEHPHGRQEGEEAALPADILPGQHGQPLPREGPLHRLVVQGVLLRLPGTRLQLPVGSDLPSHFCDEAKSLFLHHVG